MVLWGGNTEPAGPMLIALCCAVAWILWRLM
jgi:hypothetical protein